jgi:hypothetical protein
MSTPPANNRRRWTWRINYLGIVVLLGIWYFWPQQLIPPRFTISKETTWFTGPLDTAGYVDYQVAINELASQGVTPQKNAIVLLVQAIGPHPESANSLPEEFYQRLGIPRPPEDGKYFVKLHDYIKPPQEKEVILNETVDLWLDDTRYGPWDAKQYPKVAEWLKHNEAALKLVSEAVQRPRFYEPLVYAEGLQPHQRHLAALLLPCVQKIRAMGMALIARSMQSAGSRNYTAAWQDLHVSLKLARLMMQGPTLIEMLNGIAIETQALEAMAVLLEAAPQPVLELALRELARLPPVPALADKIGTTERIFMLGMFQQCHRYGMNFLHVLDGNPYQPHSNRAINRLRHVDWDPSLKRMNAWFEKLLTVVNARSGSELQKRSTEIHLDLSRKRRQLEEQNQGAAPLFRTSSQEVAHLADVVITVMTPAIFKVRHSIERSQQRHRLTLIALRLALFQRAKGAYPKTLDELSPALDASLLNDFYSGQSVLYRPTEKGYLLHSVGPNNLDDHPEGIAIGPKHDDIVIELPPPPKVKE